MVHTWGIVGAHFLRNYAPRNHQFINNLNRKGVEGHSFFCFQRYRENAYTITTILSAFQVNDHSRPSSDPAGKIGR